MSHGYQSRGLAFERDTDPLGTTQRRTGVVGDFDPLGSDSSAGDMGGLVQSIQSMSSLLAEMLVELRTQRPLLPVLIDGPTTLKQNEYTPYFFILSGKRVPSLNLVIQNNSGNLVYYQYSSPAGPGDFQLPAGGQLSVNDAAIDFISFYTTFAGITVRGVKNQSNPTGGGIVVQAWSNPEWSNVYGQI